MDRCCLLFQGLVLEVQHSITIMTVVLTLTLTCVTVNLYQAYLFAFVRVTRYFSAEFNLNSDNLVRKSSFELYFSVM